MYGHNTDARDDLELILRRVQVNPIILQNIPGVGDTLIEKLEALTDADFACVLLRGLYTWLDAVSQSAYPPRHGSQLAQSHAVDRRQPADSAGDECRQR